MFYSTLEQSDWFASLATIIEIHLRSRYRMAWNFGGLLKLWHLAEFTWRSLAIMIFIAKWLIERGGNLTGPWASFHRSYHSDAETENRLPIFLGKWPTTTPASVFKATTYTSFGLRWQATSGVQNPWRRDILYTAVDGELHADDYTGVSSCRPILHVEAMIKNNDDSCNWHWHCKVLADETLVDCSQNRQSTKINSPPKFPAIRCSG